MINKTILSHCADEGFKEKEVYDAYKIFFGTLVSESRLKIINLLRKKKMNVSEIMSALKGNQTAISHDLSRLKQCGFVLSEKEGKFVYYKLNEDTINPLMSLIDKHMSEHCIHILHNMEGKNEKI